MNDTKANDIFNWTIAEWEANRNELKQVLKLNDNWKKVPLLNVVPNHELHDQQLVRFRGMIQHMYNPEYYLGEYSVALNNQEDSVKRSGRYRDILTNDGKVVDSLDNVIEERQVFYCITVPALNEWVSQENVKEEKLRINSSSSATSPTAAKRPNDNDSSMDIDAPESTSSGTASSSNNCSNHESKRMATEARKSNDANNQLSTLNLNFPIDGASGMACLVKVYECDEHPSYKLNDVVEFLGFLSVDPSLAQTAHGGCLDAEMSTENLPPSAVPRLHAVTSRQITHANTLPADLGEVFNTAVNIRKELLLVLTQILFGDSLAAEYLICHLISDVYMRKDGLALGHLSMNISSLPSRPDFTRLLYSVLQRILPKSHYLPMTLENMNTLSFIPKMDYEANRLSSGLLQLSDNTHLVVDETRLEPGRLDVMGVKNVQALSTLISHQTVNYDFQYYSKPYDADVPVLILSEGKSLLPHDVHVPLQIDETYLNTVSETFQAAVHFLKEPFLNAVRVYVTAMRHAEHEFPDDLQKRAQDDFVQMRREQGQNVSGDDLHLLLVLAKLLSLSNGERTVSVQAWEQAKQMETQRKHRTFQLQQQANDQKQLGGNEP